MPQMADRTREAVDGMARPTSSVPHWLWTLGLASWLAVGVVAAIVLVLAFITLSASISVPLIVAIVVGAIAAPLVESMSRGVPKALGATIVLVGLILIIALTLWVTVSGGHEPRRAHPAATAGWSGRPEDSGWRVSG